MLGDKLNSGDNVNDQEDYGFTGSFFKIPPTIIYDYTIKKTEDTEVLKLGKLSSHKNIDSIEKYFYEGNCMDMSDDKDSYERYQISKNDEEKVTDVIEVLKLGRLSSQKIQTMLRNNMMKVIEWI